MKTPLATERLTEAGPDRLQIRKGGGCLSIFGIPFFAAGVFLSLIALGVLVPENADELPWWAWPLMLAMGLIFVGVGGSLVFGRTWISIDLSRGMVVREWGLIVPLKSDELSLQNYSAVAMRFDAGDSDSPDRYPIALQAQSGGGDLALLSPGDYASSRAQAERIAAFVRLPLVDSTTDHESVHHPETLNATFQERAGGESPGRVVCPATLLTSVEESGRSVRLTIPGPGFRPAMLLHLAIPLAFGAFALLQLVPFFRETDTPEPVEWLFIAFVGLFMLGPVAGALVSILRAKRARTVVTASPERITLEERAAFRTKSVDIPVDAILDIDCSTKESMMDSAKRGIATVRAARLGRGIGGVTGSVDVPRWVSWLGSLVPSKGVILKTRKGVFAIGSGLPDDEVRYLHDRLRRAVLG
jgi:hypothetical protein